jgi:23S rRNA G2069 N7-methylase RlmK/C1962 C5-methylase RlmI
MSSWRVDPCGSLPQVLSMFAAKAGAARVLAVDCSDIIEKARGLVAHNGLDRVVTLIRGKMEEVRPFRRS